MKKIIIFLEVLTFLLCLNVNAKCMDDINVIGYNLVPSFSTNTYKYNVYINGNSITIKGTSKDIKSKIEGLGTFDSLENINDYYITCDNEKYLIRAIKNADSISEDNAYLSSLVIEGYDISFDKEVFNYEIDKDKDVKVNYELENYASTLVYTEEDNFIRIEVTSEDKTKSNVYEIKINEVKNVSTLDQKDNINKELNNYQKCGVIFGLGILLLTIMCFLKRLIFK